MKLTGKKALATSSGSPQRPCGTAEEKNFASFAQSSAEAAARGPRFQIGVLIAASEILRVLQQQTALLEIELSLLEFVVSITRSVHAIEVNVVRDRMSRSVS